MRRDGWPKSPLLAEALVAVMWHGRNLQWVIGDRIGRAVEWWDRRVNAAAFNEGDDDQ